MFSNNLYTHVLFKSDLIFTHTYTLIGGENRYLTTGRHRTARSSLKWIGNLIKIAQASSALHHFSFWRYVRRQVLILAPSRRVGNIYFGSGRWGSYSYYLKKKSNGQNKSGSQIICGRVYLNYWGVRTKKHAWFNKTR